MAVKILKMQFNPGRCENPECRQWRLRRTDWLSIERGLGRGHGYHVCLECSKSLVPAEHNRFIRLLDIANDSWFRSYGAVKVGWEGEMLDVEAAQTKVKETKHFCQYCWPCPTHGY